MIIELESAVINLEKSVCFIGHRKIEDTPKLRAHLESVILNLIENGAINFIFGDNSEFDSLCYKTVTKLKERYPEIKRIKLRKDYEEADDYTMQFLISGFEGSACPKGIERAGRAAYVERNRAMITESEVCIFYYDENYLPPRRKNSKHDLTDYQPKSGTALAYAFAEKNKKRIINVYKL